MQPMFTREYLYGSNGHKKSRSLFVESSRDPEVDKPLICLKHDRRDADKYIILRDLFLTHVVPDPTETVFAELVFGDVAFWEFLKQASWMQPYYEEWCFTADVKRKAKAFQSIVKEVEEGGRASLSAAKFLIEEPWKDKRTKAAKQKSKETTQAAYSEYDEDVERLREQGLLN